MKVEPKDILDKSEDPEYLKDFIKSSDTAVTKHMNMTRVASEIFVAFTLRKSIEDLKTTLFNITERFEKLMNLHAETLNESAKVANEHTRGLKVATWVLVLVTLGLLIVTGLNYTK